MGRKFKDLSGQKIGDLKILRLDSHVNYRRWICQCSCGTIGSLTTKQIKRGHCGCLNKGRDPLLSRDKLYELYIRKKKTQAEIQKITGINRKTISKYIRMYGLDKERDYISKDKLYELYVRKEMNVLSISKELRVPRPVISSYIDKYNLRYEKMVQKRPEKGKKKRGRKPGALIGRRFGKLTVESYTGKEREVLCRCDCGNTVVTTTNNLYSFNTTSCGCTNLLVGKLRIEEYLRIHNIEYKKQYTLKSKSPYELVFDFALFSNGKLVGFIEFDEDRCKEAIKDTYGFPIIRVNHRSKGKIYEALDEGIKKLYK